MTKKRWGVLAFALLLLLAVTAIFWYAGRDRGISPGEQQGTELVELTPTRTNPSKVTAQGDEEAGTETPAYQFVLRNEDNYITVYELPKEELYEYTDLIMDVLPEEVQQEVQQGKYLKDEAELYNFLENYTS